MHCQTPSSSLLRVQPIRSWRVRVTLDVPSARRGRIVQLYIDLVWVKRRFEEKAFIKNKVVYKKYCEPVKSGEDMGRRRTALWSAQENATEHRMHGMGPMLMGFRCMSDMIGAKGLRRCAVE